MKKIASLLLYVLVLVPMAYFAQDAKAKAQAYFAKYKSKNAVNELILKSLPNLNDAKKIFTAKRMPNSSCCWWKRLKKR